MDFSCRVVRSSFIARARKLISSPYSGPNRCAPTTRSLVRSTRILAGSGGLADAVVGVPATGVAVANIDIDALVPGLLFEHPHSGELGNGEHRGRDTGVVGDGRAAVEHVGRGDLALEDRNRGERHPRCVG